MRTLEKLKKNAYPRASLLDLKQFIGGATSHSYTSRTSSCNQATGHETVMVRTTTTYDDGTWCMIEYYEQVC